MILERLSTAPGSTLAQWAAALAPQDATTACDGISASLAVRSLAQTGLQVPRTGYEQSRARLLATATAAARPGLQRLFEAFCGELVVGSEGQERIAVVEVDGCPLEGLLLAAPAVSGHYVIAVNRSFGTFANLLAKSCALAVPIAQTPEGCFLAAQGDWARGLKPGAPAIARFMEVFEATSDCKPGGAPQYLPPPERDTMVSVMRDAMELFMLSRHVATVTMEGVAKQDVELAPGITVTACSLSLEARAATALFGIGLTLNAPSMQDTLPFGYWGIDTMLYTLQMLRMAATMVNDTALLAFLGPEAPDVLSACRYGLDSTRGEGSIELEIAQTMEPATQAFFDAVMAWTDALV